VLPDFLGDERHERMQRPEQPVEERFRSVHRRPVGRLPVARFHHFKVPSGELVPEQAVQLHQRFRNAVFGKILFDLAERTVQHRVEPGYGEPVAVALRQRVVHLPAVYQPVSVPYLVAEVASLFAQRVVEQQVVAGRRAQQHRQPYAVGPVLFDQVERIGRIAERFAHLATQFVADDAGQVDVPERHFAPVFVSGDDHPGDPEEQDVGPGDQVVGRVVVFDLLVFGAVDAVEHRDRP